ncbi:MAG: thymidine phosphorylase [Gammaproteobacteria bacterium]|nr:thymidine phosphorylase [Gammaproteobacteria bacterium]
MINPVHIIEKTRDKKVLSQSEIKEFIDSYVRGDIPDYQVSSWLMSVYFNGLTEEETFYLTDAMLNSGDKIDLSMLEGVKVDKHSTGGVGDKTSLVLGPLCASCGCVMAKLSGRGLGHTGGTLDKLESIPGVTISLSDERFINQVKDIHLAIAGQTKNLVPADKKLYALRDVTGTVRSIPLIASSIMSKKVASGADVICIDVKYGSGAFMKTLDEAKLLANEMIKISNFYKRHTVCFLSNMDSPLGKAIGNRIEVKEAVDCLNGKGPKDLEELCLSVCAYMNVFSHISKNYEEGYKLAQSKLESGEAYKKFLEFVNAQGATTNDFEHDFIKVKEIIPLKAKESGYIKRIDALTIGVGAMELGAGRKEIEDNVNPNVGIYLHKQVGEYISEGETLLDIYADDPVSDELIESLYSAYEFSKEKVAIPPVIEEIIK